MKIAHHERRIVALSPERMFHVVADVERYPEFLPLMRAARIISRTSDTYETEQVIAIGLLSYRFRSHTLLNRPHSITVTSPDTNFRKFAIRWAFALVNVSDCCIDFNLDCEMRSIWFKPLGDMWAAQMALTMVNAFVDRAHSLDLAGAL